MFIGGAEVPSKGKPNIEKILGKINNGVDFFQTQYVFEAKKLEEYMKVADKQNLIYSRKVHKKWLRKPYTLTKYKGKSYKTELKLIDDETILYGNDLYKKYDLPRDFLKGS